MTPRKCLTSSVVVWLAMGLPFVIVHVTANPNEARLAPLQRAAAALANFLGPWGVAVVRLVEFPNAGLRSFSWAWALGLTLLGGVLLILPLRIRTRPLQLVFMALWGVFLGVWFLAGLRQIADGLL